MSIEEDVVKYICSNCDEYCEVEVGTWAEERELCYACNCEYEGG